MKPSVRFAYASACSNERFIESYKNTSTDNLNPKTAKDDLERIMWATLYSGYILGKFSMSVEDYENTTR